MIQSGRISYAGCILPLTLREDLPDGVGTRHRAAVGLSEDTDAVVSWCPRRRAASRSRSAARSCRARRAEPARGAARHPERRAHHLRDIPATELAIEPISPRSRRSASPEPAPTRSLRAAG
jgi:hypothetical protein